MPRMPLRVRLAKAYENGKIDGRRLGKIDAEKEAKEIRETIANETVREAIKSLRTINYMLLRVMVR